MTPDISKTVLVKPTKEHCFYAFRHLMNQLEPGVEREPIKIQNSNTNTCLFVTLMKRIISWQDDKKYLRGCIGTFVPTKMSQCLEEMAYAAAFKDSRYSQLRIEELEDISLKIFVLGPPEKYYDCTKHTTEDLFNINMENHHGAICEVNEGGSATYLPEAVASFKQPRHMFANLLKKAGAPGDMYDFSQIKSASKYIGYGVEASYLEYLEFMGETKEF